MTDLPQFEGIPFGGGYIGRFKMPRANIWRVIQKGGRRAIFATRAEASAAAYQAMMGVLMKPVRGGITAIAAPDHDTCLKRQREKAERLFLGKGKSIEVSRGKAE